MGRKVRPPKSCSCRVVVGLARAITGLIVKTLLGVPLMTVLCSQPVPNGEARAKLLIVSEEDGMHCLAIEFGGCRRGEFVNTMEKRWESRALISFGFVRRLPPC